MYTQKPHRKRIDIRLPQVILEAMDSFCVENQLTRTHYIEDLIRADLKRRGKILQKKQAVRTWETFEDMPVKPKIIIKEEAA